MDTRKMLRSSVGRSQGICCARRDATIMAPSKIELWNNIHILFGKTFHKTSYSTFCSVHVQYHTPLHACHHKNAIKYYF